jgi:hypothetical protein
MPKLIFSLTNRGTYSELNNLMLAKIYADIKGYDFFVDDRGWAGSDSGFSSFFKKHFKFWDKYLPTKSAVKMGFAGFISFLACHFFEGSKVIFCPYYFQEMGSYETWKKLLKVSRNEDVNTFLYREKEKLLTNFYKFNKKSISDMNKILNLSHFLALNESYCAVHVRRGDKILSNEMRSIPLSKYISAILLQPHRKIIIFSDDSTVYNYFRSKLSATHDVSFGSDLESFGFNEKTFHNLPPRIRRNLVLKLFSEMQIILQSSFFICTFSSNLSRFAACKLGLENCLSLDESWNPF